MDATLYAMFIFHPVFDQLMHKPVSGQGKVIQDILKHDIVYPLRKFNYLRADKVLQLREQLHELGEVDGLMSQEKDPEEFLNVLFKSLEVDNFLKLSSGHDSYCHQIFIDQPRIESLNSIAAVPTTQQLLEQSFAQGNLKLTKAPATLIVQMPHFGTSYKMFNQIRPSAVVDIAPLLNYSNQFCDICEERALFICCDCGFVSDESNNGHFCADCCNKIHRHSKRKHHKPTTIPGHQVASRQQEKMELFAVICIQTSHYVSFVRCGLTEQAPWVFYDSMADRKGLTNGYNIPWVKPCENLPLWFTSPLEDPLPNTTEQDRLKKRFFEDAYICLYLNKDMMLYT